MYSIIQIFFPNLTWVSFVFWIESGYVSVCVCSVSTHLYPPNLYVIKSPKCAPPNMKYQVDVGGDQGADDSFVVHDNDVMLSMVDVSMK